MGLLNFGVLWKVGLLIAGVFWCREIFGRLREDVAEWKTADGTRRGVLAGLWGLTVVIVWLMVTFVWGIVAAAVQVF
jgi:hypothetical protein